MASSGKGLLAKLKAKYKIHRELEEYAIKVSKFSRGVDFQFGSELEMVQTLRNYTNEVLGTLNPRVHLDGNIWEKRIPSSDISGGIPVTIYKPSNCPEDPSIFVYFHGGGLVIGCRESHDATCASISRQAQCICVNVEYRLAPENKIPAMNEDAECVVRYVMNNKSKFGGTQQSTVGVGGDSAGGGISAHLCHDVPGIDYQVLVYPSVDKTMKQPSFEEFREDLVIPRAMMDWFFMMQLSDPSADRSDPKISALYRPSFKNLPPALVILAELDPLRDCGKEYYEKLKEAGVEAECHVFEGVPHAFFSTPGVFKENCQNAYQKTAEFINKFQTSGPKSMESAKI